MFIEFGISRSRVESALMGTCGEFGNDGAMIILLSRAGMLLLEPAISAEEYGGGASGIDVLILADGF
jgi:hypothetical protein